MVDLTKLEDGFAARSSQVLSFLHKEKNDSKHWFLFLLKMKGNPLTEKENLPFKH